MTATLEARLDRLKNYHSRYELVLSHPDGRRYLVAYGSNRSRQGLFKAVQGRAQAMVKITGDENIRFASKAGDGARMCEWTIRFSGRTQRECYIEGELPYIGDTI